MPTAVELLERQVRAQLMGRAPGGTDDEAVLLETIGRAVEEYDLRSLREDLPLLGDPARARQRILDALTGFGVLQPLLDDPEIEEIWLNGPHQIFVARGGVSELTSLSMSQEELQSIVERMLAPSNRRVDLSSPFVDASLPDGSRLHVIIPELSRGVWNVNIRKFVAKARRLEQLVSRGSLSAQAARYLTAAVAAGLNIVVSGATQAGKTTLLNCLAAAIGPRERVVTIEEVFEVNVPLRDVASLQCRPANLDGAGEVVMRQLVKEALRMRPDRIIVGEVREAECFDLLLALNAGLPGLATLHANGVREAVGKLCTLPLLAGANISPAFVVPTVAATVDLVVHVAKAPDGRRHVTDIALLGAASPEGVIELSKVFSDTGQGLLLRSEACADHPKFQRAGANVSALLGSVA
jgi:pilus assembly protein CpaF